MSAFSADPVSVENALLGLSLIEGMLDPAHEATYDLLLSEHEPEALVDLMIQFGLRWLAHESHAHQMPMLDYLRHLRTSFIVQAVAPRAGADDAASA